LTNIYKNKLEQGIKYYPYIRPDYLDHKKKFEIYPLSSISNVNTLFCNEGEPRTYMSDRYGFNNKDSIWEKEIDVILIGDSFVQGSCVENKNNISSKLKKYSKKNVLNLGFSGSGPLIELGILKEYAAIIKPDYLFWFYYEGNDMMDDISLLKSDYSKYLDSNYKQGLINRQKEIDMMLKNIANQKIDEYENNNKSQTSNSFFSSIKLFNIRYSISRLFNKTSFTETSKIFKKFEKIIELTKSEVKNWNGKIIFVYIPDWSRYHLKQENNDDFHLKKQVLEIINKKKIEIIDIDREFSKSDNPLEYFSSKYKHTHYNKSGYDLISKKLSEYIK